MNEGVNSSDHIEINNIHQLKRKLDNVCKATRFCGICLEHEEKLWAVDTEFDIAVGKQTLKKLLKDIIDYILHEEGHEGLSSTLICSQCTEKAIQSYLFIYNAKQLSKIIFKCVNELYSKTVDISDQIGVVCDDYQNSNIVIVLEQDAEMIHYTDIGKMTEIIAKETSKELVSPKINATNENSNDDDIMTSFEDVNSPVIVETVSVIKDELKQDINKRKENTAELLEAGYTKVECVTIEEVNLHHSSESLTELTNNGEDYHIIAVQEHDTTFLDNFSNVEDDTFLKDIKITKKKKKFGIPSLTYQCNKCKEILPSYKIKKEHEKNCQNKDVSDKFFFKCKLCSESFVSQRSLNTHYRSHSQVRCKVCKFIIPKEHLADHLKLNHEDYIHACKLCKFFSFDANNLKAHMTKTHDGSKCALCFKKVKELDLKTHRCRFSCLECNDNVCIHYKYLISYREQVLNTVTKIKCPDCDYICPRREALLGHVNREHLDHHPFTCAHCTQQFYSRSTLRHHLNQFHKEHHICEYCDQEFSSMLTLKNHRETCEKIERHYKCDQCTSSFDNLEKLANHVKLRHEEGAVNCNLCKKKFLSSIKLQEHMFKVHNGLQMKRKNSILNCPICEIKFDNKKQLMQHIETHGSDVRYPCKECNTDFDSIRKLHAHIRIHYDDVIQCADCKKVLTTTFFPHHMVYCKPGREEKGFYTCETCGKVYNSESQLKLHRKNHLEKIPCPVCNKPTKPIYMKNHIKYMHSKGKPQKLIKGKSKYFLKCDFCNHLVSRQAELEAHVNRFHLKVKPYQCNYCQKAFFGKDRLRDHLITHTSSKACFCTVCNHKFENKACLKLHMRRHTGYSPYTCEICGDRFRTSSIMNTHKVKKHSERTVACPLCESMFFLTREMRSHFKKVHWKQKDKKFDPRDVKELRPEFYYLFEDGRLPKVEGEGLCISSKFNEKFA